jgi:hypothetical protein
MALVGAASVAQGVDDEAVQLRRSWQEWEVDGRERRVVLVVETGLEMRPGHDGFDAAALDKLISDVTAEMRASPSPIDRVRIVPQLD